MNWQRWALILLMLMGFTLSWLLLKPEILGFIYDDGLYLLAAKSLAYGQGYWMQSKFPTLAIVKYPPLFPLLLAPLWWIFPHFPENIVAFKLVPLICLLGVLYLVYRQGLRQHPEKSWLALIPVGLLALDCSVSFVSSALFSETFYMLLSLAVLFWIERHNLSKSDQSPTSFKMALFSVMPYYTRSIGITLVLAVFIWLWQQKGFKQAGRYLLWSSLLVSPWLAWSILNAPPVSHWKDIILVDYNHSYTLDLWINYHQLGGFFPWLWDGIQSLSLVMVNRIFRILAHLPLTEPIASLFQNILAGTLGLGILIWALKYRSAKWSLSILYAALYLIALVFWSTDKEQYWRLLIPLFPLFWLSLMYGFRQNKKIKVLLILFILQFLTGSLISAQTLLANHFSTRIAQDAPDLWSEYQETFRFLKTVPQNQILLTPYSNAYYLYTGHRVWNLNTYLTNPTFGQDNLTRLAFLNIYEQLLKKNHVRYVITEPAIGFTNINRPLAMPLCFEVITHHPDQFDLVYQSRSKAIKIYKAKE